MKSIKLSQGSKRITPTYQSDNGALEHIAHAVVKKELRINNNNCTPVKPSPVSGPVLKPVAVSYAGLER